MLRKAYDFLAEMLPARLRKKPEYKNWKLEARINHIINKLIDINDFVLSDPHLNRIHAHCPHLQIAQANPQ